MVGPKSSVSEAKLSFEHKYQTALPSQDKLLPIDLLRRPLRVPGWKNIEEFRVLLSVKIFRTHSAQDRTFDSS